MSTQIKYTNIFGNPITAQQQSTLLDFKKMTFLSNDIKTIEIFEQVGDISYKSVKYFIDATENKQDIIQKYVDPSTNSNLVIFSNRIQANGFDLWDWESYERSSEIYFKGKEVFDGQLRTVFVCSFNKSTNALLPGSQKYYHGNQFVSPTEDLLLEFIYDANGNVDLVFDSNENYGYIEGISLATFLDDANLSQDVFPWDEHPYYHSVLPYLPFGNL
ncbi:hypothetical protein [Mucilaginibacter aquaedulcis]|uniref:hypothetical protein n=1 Tax=Mucilaginibacter aquaedulcis TaxID=1187081 RepID=UPI0025B29390|nr:hypothetical protein [Mucilaginibacter aquaedulcis]MDN3548772.1 hypothetical protein [Mucilaginibacter aquaedulcis]